MIRISPRFFCSMKKRLKSSVLYVGEKVRIGTMDLRIASIALANGFTLLTRNLVDFQQVPGLKVEDWTAGPPR
jgi:predicted nucleic acid-binding protein